MTADRPRVVFLGHSAQPSGAELGLLRLTRAMTRYEPVVVLAEQGPLVDDLRTSGVRCEVAELATAVTSVRHAEIKPGRQLISAGRQVVRYSDELRRLLRALAPDIVDTFTLKAHVYGRLALRGLSVPRVAHVHDRLSTQYMRRASIALLRPILGRCDGLVFNSTSTRDTVPSLRRGQVRATVGSAVDRPLQTARESPAGPAFAFGCIGRITPWKGQRQALRAFAEVCDTHRERDLRLILVGGAFFGEEDYLADLQTLAADLGVTDRTEWTGHVSDVYSQLDRMDALVHCSTIPEPFGQVVVEGMAFGIPVIAPDEGGPADLITDGATGIFYTPRDAQALAGAMARAITLPAEQRRAMTTAARTVAEQFFAGAVAEQIEAFYDEVRKRSGLLRSPRFGPGE